MKLQKHWKEEQQNWLLATKEELGASAGIKVGTAAVAIIAEGDSKKIIAEIKPAETPKKEVAPKEEKSKETEVSSEQKK